MFVIHSQGAKLISVDHDFEFGVARAEELADQAI